MTPEIWFYHLGIKIDKLNRVAFSIGSFSIYWYGIIIGLGVLAGFLFARHEAKRIGLDPDILIDYLFYGIIASVICARLYYVIFSWDDFKDNLIKIFAIREGGIAIYGAIIGATISAIIFTKIKKIPFFKFTDCCVLGLLIGQIMGRYGNFVNREAFGGYTDGLFAMRYLKSQVGSVPQSVLDHIVVYNSAEYIQVHPTFLYESCWNIMIFILLNLFKKHKKFDGELTALYFIGYGIGRFWIEGLRTDQLIIGHTGIAISQVVSVVMIAVSAAFIIYNKRKIKLNGGIEGKNE